jgi:hypothetical protein
MGLVLLVIGFLAGMVLIGGFFNLIEEYSKKEEKEKEVKNSKYTYIWKP